MQRLRLAFLSLLVLAGLGQDVALAAVPAGFNDTLVTNVGSPTALAFTPDGRMLIGTQTGALRVYQGGSLLPTAALTFNTSSQVCTDSERGLLGIAVDPAFASNNFIYLYYTARTPACKNRVARFTLPPSNVISPASQLVLIDQIHSTAGNHNGGDLNFGHDGFLYVSVGDGGSDYAGDSGGAGSNDAARDHHVMLGKILRITSTGGIPASNPFQGADSGRCNVTGSTTIGNWCQETFAWGLRNPFRIAFDEDDPGTRFFINDVGQGAREEIDLGQAGADYGWNCREGNQANPQAGSKCSPAPPNMVSPIHDYPRSVGSAITGGAFVPNGVWPLAYDNDYMFADYGCGCIFSLRPNGSGGFNRIDFATGLGSSSAVHLRFGPFASTQALYYTSYAGGGEVRRVSFGNANPIVVLNAAPTAGPAPLTVNFNATGSSDPDTGDILTYVWTFGDGSPVQQGPSPTISHTYGFGSFVATLRVQDNRSGATERTVAIDSGNTPPVATITAPTASARFRVGQSVTLTGAGTDAQEGTLPASALSWRVLLHHNTHTHPFLPPTTGNNVVFTTPAPEDLSAAASSFLEIILTVRDSNGGVTSVSQDFRPNTVSVTFDTNPDGLHVTANGTSLTGPQTVVSWQGYVLNLTALSQLDASRHGFAFSSWSDAGAASHAITTPASASTYTATFVPAPVLEVNDVKVTEGNAGTKAATFTVSLVPSSSATVTVAYATQPGTATSPSDYTALSGGLTFAPGETTKTVTVQVLGDAASESNEAFGLVLSSPTNGLLARPIGEGAILDDDTPGRTPIRPQAVWQEFFAVDLRETPLVGDFDGDGKSDIVTFTRNNPLSFGDVYVALSDGVKFGPSMKWHDFFAISPQETVVIGDYDGDGRDDIATWLGASTRQVYVARSLGNGMTAGTVWLDSVGFDSSDVLRAADVDGDGKADLVLFNRSQGRVYVALSEGSRFAAPAVWHSFFAVSTYERPATGDLDGDGAGDIITFATDSPTAFGDVYTSLSIGTRFGTTDFSEKWHDFFAIRQTEKVQVGDLNGDRRDDFFTFLPPPFAQCYTAVSLGDSMGPSVLWPEAVAPLGTDVPLVGDVNGDGRADILVFAQAEGKVYVSLTP